MIFIYETHVCSEGIISLGIFFFKIFIFGIIRGGARGVNRAINELKLQKVMSVSLSKRTSYDCNFWVF